MGNRNNILILLVIILVSAFRIWGRAKSKIFKSAAKKKSGTYSVFLSSLLSIGLCTVCLFGATWAWFTSSASAVVSTIKSPSYSISVNRVNGEIVTPIDNGSVTVGDNCSITLKLKADGTTGATGYCVVKIGETTYYTDQITADRVFIFTVNAAAGTQITITPQWGSCAVRTDENKITNGMVIGQTLPHRENPADEPVDEVSDDTTPATSADNEPTSEETDDVTPGENTTDPDRAKDGENGTTGETNDNNDSTEISGSETEDTKDSTEPTTPTAEDTRDSADLTDPDTESTEENAEPEFTENREIGENTAGDTAPTE